MRTKNSILNFVTSFFPWLILAGLGFFKIKFFITSYGSELNGLIQLINQVFTFLSIASLGFTSAIIYYLYDPLIKKDYNKINQLVSGSKIIFKRIGIIIFVGGLVASLLVPYVIYQMNIPKLFVFFLFFLYALDYLSTYLLLLPYKVIFEADQKSYIVNYLMNTKQLLFRTLELFLILIKLNLLLIVLISVISNFIVNKLIILKAKRIYNWLNLNEVPDNTPLKMTKDVFYHRVMKFIFHNTDVMLISIFKGLKVVSIYGTYNYITQYLLQLINFIYKAPQAAIANFIKSGYSKEKTINLIEEYLAISFIIGLVVIPVFIVGAGDFVNFWINKSYVLNKYIILLFGITLWSDILSYSLFSLIEANGLFQETKKIALVASLLNIILSFILIFNYGIGGVLLATFISNVVLHIFYAIIIFKQVINITFFSFFKKYLFNFGLIIINILICFKISKCLVSVNIVTWLFKYGIIFVINLIITLIISFIFEKQMKNIYRRGVNLFLKKNK